MVGIDPVTSRIEDKRVYHWATAVYQLMANSGNNGLLIWEGMGSYQKQLLCVRNILKATVFYVIFRYVAFVRSCLFDCLYKGPSRYYVINYVWKRWEGGGGTFNIYESNQLWLIGTQSIFYVTLSSLDYRLSGIVPNMGRIRRWNYFLIK